MPSSRRGSATLEWLLSKCVENVKTGCLEWCGRCDRKGYGEVWHQGRPHRAHRLVWQFTKSETLEPTVLLLHSCDNPKCCRVNHLRPGTHQENMADRLERGRPGSAKITAATALAIFTSTKPSWELSTEYAVSEEVVRRIKRRDTWGHVTDGVTPGICREVPCGRLIASAKLTETEVRAIYADPRSQMRIAADYGVTQTAVGAIKRGKTWSWLTGHNNNMKETAD